MFISLDDNNYQQQQQQQRQQMLDVLQCFGNRIIKIQTWPSNLGGKKILYISKIIGIIIIIMCVCVKII